MHNDRSRAANITAGNFLLDKRNHEIIRQLQVDGRRNATSIARMTGLDRRTVTARIDALTKRGVLRFAPVTDPRTLGYVAIAFVCIYPNGNTNPLDVYEQAANFPDTTYVTHTTGRFAIQVEIMSTSDNDLRNSISKMIKLLPAGQSIETLYCLRIHFQRSWFHASTGSQAKSGIRPYRASRIDRDIIRLLAADGRIPFKTIASRLEVSESLVRKRYHTLVASNIFRVVGIVNPLHLGYRATCWLAITVCSNSRINQVAEALTELQEVSFIAITAGSVDLMVEVVCRDHEQLIMLLDAKVNQIAGIERAEPWMYLRLEHKPMLPMPPER